MIVVHLLVDSIWYLPAKMTGFMQPGAGFFPNADVIV